MKQDAELRLMLRERAKGRTQEQAAARAGMSVRTARAYERRARLPSQLKQPRTYRSRPNPFADDWPWIARLLEDDPALQGQTLFGLLCDRQPGRYQEGQLRTLQRHIAAWRAQFSPEREVMFPQVHEPGEAAQSDFTYMNSLGVTLGGVPFPHRSTTWCWCTRTSRPSRSASRRKASSHSAMHAVSSTLAAGPSCSSSCADSSSVTVGGVFVLFVMASAYSSTSRSSGVNTSD